MDPRPKSDIPDLTALPPDAMLTRKQMVALSGFTVHAFNKWARNGLGRGPRITLVEGRPRYRAADARTWLAGRPR